MRAISPLVHEPEDDCLPVHCHIHHVDEHADDPYSACYECGHLYRTPGHVRAAYLRRLTQMLLSAWTGHGDRRDATAVWLRNLTVPARRIDFCPHCSHDF